MVSFLIIVIFEINANREPQQQINSKNAAIDRHLAKQRMIHQADKEIRILGKYGVGVVSIYQLASETDLDLRKHATFEDYLPAYNRL